MTLDSTFSLAGKVAIVTGSSAGIGLGIANGLAAAGADLVLTARGAGRVTDAVDEVKQHGTRVLGISGDVTEPEHAERLIREALDQFGRVDILVNNAGGSFGTTFNRGPLLDLTLNDLVGCFTANLAGTFLCSKAAVPVMRAQGSGSIIIISSVGGRMMRPPTPGMGFYSATKAALINLTMSMATEWAPEIRVNAITPGAIATPRTAADHAKAVPSIALGRVGMPEDIAGAAVFLSSDAASWITGAVLDIHGGLRNAS